MARLMAITAHPQDLAERTGGTAAKHIERGDEVMWVSLTTGVVTHAFNTFPATGEDKLKDIERIKDPSERNWRRRPASWEYSIGTSSIFRRIPWSLGSTSTRRWLN